MSRRKDPVLARGRAQALDLGLSVSVITLNEERNIARCLESVRGLANQIVVVDSGSTDATREIAAGFGAEVIHNDWRGHVGQANVALSRCTQPWVLCLDADEALDEQLRDEIVALLQSGPRHEGYAVNRLMWYLGDWLRFAWQPEWRTRLVRRERARWEGMDPHSHLIVNGATARLGGNLLHYSYVDLDHHLRTTVNYGRISGEQLVRRGKRVPLHKLVFSPMIRGLKVLILQQGWRDGWRGLIVAYATVLGGFVKYACAIAAQRAGGSAGEPEP